MMRAGFDSGVCRFGVLLSFSLFCRFPNTPKPNVRCFGRQEMSG
jgi:hypothetical protein